MAAIKLQSLHNTIIIIIMIIIIIYFALYVHKT